MSGQTHHFFWKTGIITVLFLFVICLPFIPRTALLEETFGAPTGYFSDGKAKTDEVRVFTRPDKQSEIVKTLKKGESARLIQQIDDWLILRLSDNALAWGHEDDFIISPPVSQTGTHLVDTSSAEPPRKTRLQKTGVQSEAVNTEESVETAAPPKIDPAETAIITVRSARVRQAPTTQSDLMFGLKRGDTVTLLATDGDWRRIRASDGKSGWIHTSLIQEAGAAGASAAETPPPSGSAADVSPGSTSADQPEGAGRVERIRVDAANENEEKVIIKLNGFYPPKTFVIEEDIPKVVCDFTGIRPGDSVPSMIPANGEMIRTVRTGLHEGDQITFRVVLDLVPQRDYDVKQLFFKAENIYTLVVKPID